LVGEFFEKEGREAMKNGRRARNFTILLAGVIFIGGLAVATLFNSNPLKSSNNTLTLAGDYRIVAKKRGKDLTSVSGTISFSKESRYFFSINERVDDPTSSAFSGNGTYKIVGDALVLKPTISRFSGTVVPDIFKFRFRFNNDGRLYITGFSIKDFAVAEEVEYVLTRKNSDDPSDKENGGPSEENDDNFNPPDIPANKNPDKRRI